MLVTPATLKTLQSTFKGLFQDAFKGASPLWPRIATKVPSTGPQNVYGWIDDIPGMREWLGDRVINDLTASDYTLVNKKFEFTIGMARTDIEDDNLGVYTPRLEMGGIAAAHHPDTYTISLLNDGFTKLCWDGKAFFATNHSWHGKTFSNRSSLALDATNYGTVRANLRKTLGDRGTSSDARTPLASFGELKFTLVVPAELEGTARAILENEKGPLGEDNVWKGTADVLVLESLTSATAWFLLVTSLPVRPLIYQHRQDVRFTELTDPNSDTVMLKDQYVFGADYRAAFGYSLWQLAYGSTGS